MKRRTLLRASLLSLTVMASAALVGCGSNLCCRGGSSGGVNLPPGFTFLGIALVPRPEGAATSGNGTDFTIVRGLNGSSPVSDTTPLTTPLYSLDSMDLTDDAKVGIVDGENNLAVLTGMDTATPVVGSAVSAPDGGSASGVMMRNDGKSALIAGDDGLHIVDTSGTTPVVGPVLAGGFRTGSDSLVYSPDRSMAVIGNGNKGFGGGDYTKLQVVLNASSASPTPGPTVALPAPCSGYEGHAGLSISPADPTRMTVPVDNGIVLVTGLNTATPTVGPVVSVAALPSGDSVIATAITRDGKRVAVCTEQGVIVYSGVDTGTLTPATPFLSLDAAGQREHGNMGVQFALDNRAFYVSNDNTQMLYVITGTGGSTLTLSDSVPLLPAESGRMDNDTILLH